MTKISPDHDESYLQPITLEKAIDVYESQVRGWMLNWAKDIHGKPHAGYAALQLALAYFEGHAMFYYGKDTKGKSEQYFKKGFVSVFPPSSNDNPKVTDKIADILYRDGRCGLYHIGMARPKIGLFDGDHAFTYKPGKSPDDVDQVYVNVHLFVERIDEHFTGYLKRLRDPGQTALRSRFIEAWNLARS